MSKTITKPKALQKKTTQDNKIRMPAILCDIDGVVIRGTGSKPNLIGNSLKTIRKVLSTKRANKKVPFIFLTNGGSETESSKI
jgi:ribonucleotide monophosphatase NagD (HAD superfamily)